MSGKLFTAILATASAVVLSACVVVPEPVPYAYRPAPVARVVAPPAAVVVVPPPPRWGWYGRRW